mmetsp:Transcript_21114/g.25393  ORF Transcript_21114/g.25393 Transcript_21114/m.25393 type:complete len:861 (-) Transcript_21114:1076-3658(-)|eukprot:CAMPEP_0197849708 /NCGR_PEP_ID=MMETSP1438-20131217/12953_1 /TAXON_ID=1461541 /ORGANISM="Pterosperma sp., Strain CCMP1384" /LENGTH=860 /DNA_ID=CAMNT_0043462505 /DNA_START=128 /DNA_END=2710 /DNA_ORIENTATION=-
MNFSRITLCSVLFSLWSQSVSGKDCATQPEFLVKPDETVIAGSVVSLTWVESTDQIIFALSGAGTVYRSEDGGKTWRSETLQHLNGIKAGERQIVQMSYNDKQSHGQIFFTGYGGVHWATVDYGKTYIQPCGYEAEGAKCISNPGGNNTLSVPQIKLHPKLPNHLLAKVRRDVCFRDGDALTNEHCTDDVYYSENFGLSWTNLTQNSAGAIQGFRDFEWAGDKDGNQLGILATVWRHADSFVDGKTLDGKWDKHLDFIRTEDFFAPGGEEDQTLLECGNLMFKLSGKVFVAAPRDCNRAVEEQRDQGVDLFISTEKGEDLHQICIPVTMQNRGFALLDVDHQGIFLAIDHDEEDMLEGNMPAGNVYKSDESFKLFSLSQRHVFMDRNTELADFTRIQGLPATIVSNQLDITGLDDPDILTGTRQFTDLVKTTISFSDGASWESIPPPKVDVYGDQIKCHSKDCSLHLHGTSSWALSPWTDANSWFPAVYSQHHAAGVVVGVGNVGKYLSRDPEHVNTYLSRDGGQTFQEIMKGPGIFEFGDKGGLLVIAKHMLSGPTDEIYFTRNEGGCLEGPIKLAQKIMIQNIRVEPDAENHVFIIHGYKEPPPDQSVESYNDIAGVMVTLDFRALLGEQEYPACTPIEDYEWWSPTHEHCLLGHNITIERRKPASKCWNGPQYTREKVRELEPCKCSFHADIQCEYGFERKQVIENNTLVHNCMPIVGLNISKCPAALGMPHAKEGNYIMKNDVCTNATEVLVEPKELPVHHHNHGHHKPMSWAMTLFITLLCMGAIVGALTYAYTNLGLADHIPPDLRDKVEGAWEFMKGKLGGGRDSESGYAEEGMHNTFQPLAADEFGEPRVGM